MSIAVEDTASVSVAIFTLTVMRDELSITPAFVARIIRKALPGWDKEVAQVSFVYDLDTYKMTKGRHRSTT